MAENRKAARPRAKQAIQPSDATGNKKIARALMRPSVQAAATIQDFEKSEVNLVSFIEELSAQVEAVRGGDLKRSEAILITQAHTLNELFNNLARRANKQEYLKQFETYLRLALKAQTQCRATLETLAAIKNPPIVYARQANIANGPQQINNGTAAPSHAREEKSIQSNELLNNGVEHGPTLDTRGAAAASGADKELATVGAIDRAKDDGR